MTHKPMETLPKNTIIYFSQGEYSDYCVIGVFKCLQPLTVDEAILQWKKENPEQARKWVFDGNAFVAHLVKTKVVKEIDATEVDLPYS